ncbi:MAG: succinate dehydrogenase, cytochrome b556 subunit [Gammaproteobacteria bacterium HGW-Gammaproteobacteria-10]|nr:MAG: succinate dehydrogenase, cytochrome b556 subunit [Gammaproteobacteria bacterium HGW-Gammaproteobacteria-10]
MNSTNRPLSPHLQVYRLPLTGLISITHRMTGVMLSLGLILFVCMLYAIAGGAEAFAAMQAMTDSILLQIVLWGFMYALFFHLCHGVRHLIWDAGSSFDNETLNRYALIELFVSLVLTAATFAFFIL